MDKLFLNWIFVFRFCILKIRILLFILELKKVMNFFKIIFGNKGYIFVLL